MAIATRLEVVTPKKAQSYLDNRASNRPVSERYAQQLAGAMKAGEFEVNGETLKFDADKRMIDGQHRCRAGVISEKTFETFVTRGLNSSTFDTIDTGHKRTISHVFAKHGEENYALLAGAIGWLWRLKRGLLASGRANVPRHAEAIAMLQEYPDIRNSIVWGHRCKKLANPSIVAFLHYEFSYLDSAAADWFFGRLADGEDLKKTSRTTSGVYVLRERLNDDKASKAKLPSIEIIKLIIKAWNATRKGKLIKNLSHRTTGDAPEPFPRII